MTEEWRQIPGYDPKYEVSNLGRVRTRSYVVSRTQYGRDTSYMRPGRILALRVGIHGRVMVHIGITMAQVHRLVALAFIPNPDNLPEINHKDQDPTNNKVDNLEWCTRKYNMNYKDRAVRYRKAVGLKIERIDENGDLIASYDSARMASRETGISKHAILDQIHGVIKNPYKKVYWRLKK